MIWQEGQRKIVCREMQAQTFRKKVGYGAVVTEVGGLVQRTIATGKEDLRQDP